MFAEYDNSFRVSRKLTRALCRISRIKFTPSCSKNWSCKLLSSSITLACVRADLMTTGSVPLDFSSSVTWHRLLTYNIIIRQYRVTQYIVITPIRSSLLLGMNVWNGNKHEIGVMQEGMKHDKQCRNVYKSISTCVTIVLNLLVYSRQKYLELTYQYWREE